MTTITLKSDLLRPVHGTRETASAFALLARVLGQWRQRATQRRHLGELTPELLRDIGVSAASAKTEAVKPFWCA